MKRKVFWFLWSIFCVICWLPALHKYHVIGAEANLSAGVNQFLMNVAMESQIDIEEEEKELVEESSYIQLLATAYCDSELADGTKANPNRNVLAGKKEWLGRSVDLYDSNMNYLGYYTFHDVGYGRPTGYGESELLIGKSLGDIETGEVIDVLVSDETECEIFGKRTVYMQWVNE